MTTTTRDTDNDTTHPYARTQTTPPDWNENHTTDMEFNARTHQVRFPDELNDRLRWMGATPGAKNPFAPWGDRNPAVGCTNRDCPADRMDDPKCDCDGRFKWGYEGHYVTGKEVDRAISSFDIVHRAYIFHDDDPYLFVDFDNVRCPETGTVHPAAIAFLAHHPATWTEVSVSGGGLHAVYRGELPGNVVQATVQLDDTPWGAHADADCDGEDNNNPDLPVIELYDTARKAAVLPGTTVSGAPCEISKCDEGVLESMLDAHDYLPQSQGSGSDVPGVFDDDTEDDSTSNESSSTGGARVTDDMETVFDAINALDAREVADQTIVREWIDPPGTEHRAFVPTWAPSEYDGAAVYCTENKFVDSGHRGGWGGPVIMAAIDKKIISDHRASPGDVDGDDFRECVEYLIDLGFTVPRYVPCGDSAQLYIEVLKEYAPEWGDPYTDPDACLVAALRARDNGSVMSDADPPTLALNSIIDHMWAVSPGSHAVDEGVLERARELFGSLDEEKAIDRFDIAMNRGDSA